MDNSSSQFYSPNNLTTKKSKGKLILFLLLLIIIAALAIFGTMRFLQARDSALETTPSPTQNFTIPTEPPLISEEPEPTGSSSATPSPTGKVTPAAGGSVDKATGLDRSKLTIEIQNGSGIAGAAGKVKTVLEDLGYVITKTGNADTYDYEETVIKVKATRKSYLPLLEKDLEGDYTIGSTSAALTGSTADAVVIVGKE